MSPVPHGDFVDLLEHFGKDPSRLIFEDELTGIHNRRFLLSYLEHRVRWNEDTDFPLSLLIIDLDRFKEINDTHGHDTGDQVLIWMATLLKEVAGQHGIPIRFGGDEFAVLLPHASRTFGREMADRLLQRGRDRAFHLRDAGVTVPITLSVGVATAPDDAGDAKELFQAADRALYHAKQSGRDQAATAAEIDPEKVFPRTALHRLNASGIAGREDELAVVAEALEELERGRSQFLVFEGGPGMGKSTFLDTVRRNLSGDDTFWVTQVSGDQKEGYRPYYLANRLLVAMLNQREDKGAAVLQELSRQEVAYLSHVLPQLLMEEAAVIQEDARSKRQGIFSTLARVIPRIVDVRPVLFIIDDLQHADEATLLLLRVLLQRDDLSLCVCGSALEPLHLGDGMDETPLERFYARYERGLQVRRETLEPLSETDIHEYLRGVFPVLRTPPGFERELARITQGNPLFLGEIIRKLVEDRRATLQGQMWIIDPLEEGYLPRSLEEIVQQKIQALNWEERELLKRASTLGEDIPLSVLAGSSALDENRILEFLDRAEALGLVSLDFQVNDEIMKFLGKQVLEISYGTIQERERLELHESVGHYQEELYQRRLLPSASLLAYHFKRSANQQKAQRYEQVQLDYSQTVFDPKEAANYTGDVLEEEVDTEPRLDPESVPRVPHVLRALMSAVRNIRLYPPESAAIGSSLESVQDEIEWILERNEQLHLAQAQRRLLANGQRLDVSSYQILADSYLELLTRSELQGMIFRRGVRSGEIRSFLMELGNLKPETIDPGYWKSFAAEHALEGIELRQMRYSRIRRKRGRVVARSPAYEEEELRPEELSRLPEVLRAFIGAARNVRLYPLDSEPATRAIQQLQEALTDLLNGRRTLTLAHADQALLVNGERVDTSSYADLAGNVLDLLDSVGLTSITFFSDVPLEELVIFYDALRQPDHIGADGEFWDQFKENRQLGHLAFNQRQYALTVVQSLLGSVEVPVDADVAGAAEEAAAEWAERISEEPFEALREALPRFGKELLIKGEHGLMQRLLSRLFSDYSREEDPRARLATIQACRALLGELILGLQHRFTTLAADPLLGALADEDEPRVLQELAGVLYGMAASAVKFADYVTASRILLELKTRRTQLSEEFTEGEDDRARLLERRLDPTTQKLLKDDLASGQPDRHERAAQVVGSLGRAGIPLLLEVIKEEKDFRVRQLAASLLAEVGPEAAEQIKRALGTEVIVEQRFRIMEVADTVTRDLEDELAYNFGDSSPKIRRAAFRLFERLGDDSLIDVILPLARDPDVSVAKGAIRSLAHLRSKAAVEALESILEETEDDRVAIACCQALGELGHAGGIEALANVLGARKFLWFGRRYEDQVRATAAIALRQISHPRAAEILKKFRKDRVVRVRRLARPESQGESA